MDNVNKTLYIPLFGKAFVSKKGIILRDEKAESIWNRNGFPLKGKSSSKWLAYYMGMRAAVFDEWTNAQLSEDTNSIVIHIGCGLDSRVDRIEHAGCCWYDVDFPDVITERRKFYCENNEYCMIGADVRTQGWINTLPKAKRGIVIMEGISMYLQKDELKLLLTNLCSHFERLNILADFYTVFAAKMSKYKNPINDVGVTDVYGINDAAEVVSGTSLNFVKEHSMTPDSLISELQGVERKIFKRLYAGRFSEKLYRLYEYCK